MTMSAHLAYVNSQATTALNFVMSKLPVAPEELSALHLVILAIGTFFGGSFFPRNLKLSLDFLTSSR